MDALSPARPVEELQIALSNFCAILTDEQRHDLAEIRTVPDADSILTFTAQLDFTNRSRRGQSVGSRVAKVLHSTRDFCAVVDTFVSSHPEIAALIWGSVKLTMQIIINYTSYYEAISGLFMQLGHLCPLFAEYGTLYRDSKPLQKALSDFHASIVRCCKHVIEAIRRPWHSQVLQAFYTSFDQEFASDIDDLRRYGDTVKDAIHLAKAYVDAQEQKLQYQERVAASENRSLIKSFISRRSDENDELRELLLRKERREAQERKQRLLEELCVHHPERLLKQNQRKRFRDTASWIINTAEFRSWVEANRAPLLWCSGKIGSGKTVVAASVVDYFLLDRERSGCLVSYFFIHSSSRESLDIETVMRSILRQRLPASTDLSLETEQRLRRLIDGGRLDDIVTFLGDITRISKPSYIIVDGLDECGKSDRGRLLQALSSLANAAMNTKLFIASRESLSGEIREHFPSTKQVSMDNSGARGDMVTYINGILQAKLDSRELIIGDPSLINEIERALTRSAEGMFLWVFFQVHEICEQTCDEDIRETIANLPEGLEETFCRVLRRIASRSHTSKLAQRVFPWIAASLRPLSLEELREAIAIEIGQPYSRPERLCNDINIIVLSCENLVHVDEEDQSIQFAHHSIKQFLVQKPIDYSLRGFHVDLEDADHLIGEICVTYLNLNDFKTTLVQRPKPIPLPKPSDIALSTLGRGSKLAAGLKQMLQSTEVPAPIEIDHFVKPSKDNSILASRKFNNAYPFLKYASVNWILHTKHFRENRSKMWNAWKRIVIDDYDLAIKPWPPDSSMDYLMQNWAQQACHEALIYLVISFGGYEKLCETIYKTIEVNNLALLDALLQHPTSGEVINDALLAAAKCGREGPVEMLIDAGADVDSIDSGNGMTALQIATMCGYIGIVNRLIVAGADTNSVNAKIGDTALQLATSHGNISIVNGLLKAGAGINAINPMTGDTAFQLAIMFGYMNIANKLIAAGADINAINPATGNTALQLAVKRGRSDVILKLLGAGADANVVNPKTGDTALQSAVQHSYLHIIQNLLAAGADPNTVNPINGYTALQLAAEYTHWVVTENLLAAGADVNTENPMSGYTALQLAVRRGHASIIILLLAAGADTDVVNAETGYTALQLAVHHNHFDVVKDLLRAGADLNAINPKTSKTARQLAVDCGYFGLVEMVRKAAGSADSTNPAIVETIGRALS